MSKQSGEAKTGVPDKRNSVKSPINKEAKKDDKKIILPSEDKGILYKVDESTEVVTGPFNAQKLREVIKCDYFERVSFPNGTTFEKFQLWIDEEGRYSSTPNKRATAVFGKSTCADDIYGNVLVVRSGVIE